MSARALCSELLLLLFKLSPPSLLLVYPLCDWIQGAMAPGAEPWDPDRVDEEENEGEVEEQLQEIRAYERL